MKAMEPRKAKTATIITAVTAVLILAVCLCMLLDVNPFAKKEEAPEPTATPEAAAAAKPEPERAPSVDDLKGCADDLYLPKAENYLPAYKDMITNATEGRKVVYVQKEPKPWQYSREIVTELENNTHVTALAQENGYTLVLVKEGVAGWVITQDLYSG